MALQLLPGEKEEMSLHPAAASFFVRRLWAIAILLWGGILWAIFHSVWWTTHTTSDWTAAWTWLWGTAQATYLWTLGGLVLGGWLACLPRGPWAKAWIGAFAGLAVCALVKVWFPQAPEFWLPVLTMFAALPAFFWLEMRRYGVTYHVTSMRLVVRTTVPRRSERSVLYSELVDLDAKASGWPDTGTLIPVVRAATVAGSVGPPQPPPPPPMPGVRPLKRVRALVSLLAQRATASEVAKAEGALDRQVAEALAALHRP